MNTCSLKDPYLSPPGPTRYTCAMAARGQEIRWGRGYAQTRGNRGGVGRKRGRDPVMGVGVFNKGGGECAGGANGQGEGGEQGQAP